MAQALTLEGYLIGHPSGLKIRPQHKTQKDLPVKKSRIISKTFPFIPRHSSLYNNLL